MPPTVRRQVLLLDHLPAACNVLQASPPLTNSSRPRRVGQVRSHETALSDNLQHGLTRYRVPEDHFSRRASLLLPHAAQPEALGLGLKALQRGTAKYARQAGGAGKLEGEPPDVVGSEHQLLGLAPAQTGRVVGRGGPGRRIASQERQGGAHRQQPHHRAKVVAAVGPAKAAG